MRTPRVAITTTAASATLLATLVAALAVVGCSAGRGASIPAGRAIGAAVDDGEPGMLALAAGETFAAFAAKDPRTGVSLGGASFTNEDLAKSARRVAAIAASARDAATLTADLAKECRAFPAAAPAKVTGYYEPVLAARRSRDRYFRYPVYRQPSAEQLDAVRARVGHVPTREDIDGRGALAGLGLELAWLDDPVARFFLHVQGSGRLVFEDGASLRVGFAGTNGLEYRSVGAAMLERGLLERGRATAPAMRAWLAAHADRRDALLYLNQRYVFFRDRGDGDPTGSFGATLVGGRSIAGDPRYVPPGILAWLRSSQPVAGGDGAGTKPLARFVFAHDTGAAIQGPGRVDLYFGSGEDAGVAAGAMNESGELFLLLCDRPGHAPGGEAPEPPVSVPRPGPIRGLP